MSTEGDQIIKNCKMKIEHFCWFSLTLPVKGNLLAKLVSVEWLFPFFYFCCKKEVFWPAFGQILENCWCLNHLWSRKFCRENPDSKIAHCIPFICIIKRVESSFSKMTFIFHLRMKFKFSTLQQTIQKLAKTRKKFRKIEKKKEIPKWWFFENLKLAVKQCYQTGHF